MDHRLLALQALFTKWKLNKVVIAQKCGMNEYTFKMKLYGKPNYSFTDLDYARITIAINELHHDISTLNLQ